MHPCSSMLYWINQKVSQITNQLRRFIDGVDVAFLRLKAFSVLFFLFSSLASVVPVEKKNYPPFLNDAENNSFTSVRIDDLSELKTLGRCYLSKMYAGFVPSSYILLELAVETIIGTNLLSAFFSLVLSDLNCLATARPVNFK